MKTSRIFLTITMLALVILVFTGCQGVVPTPSPGATEDVTVIIGRIKMPLTCCAPEGVYTESSDKDCDEAELWPFVPNAVVELKSAAKGKCKTVLATTLTDEDGNYLFEDVKPGLYIITAYCPEETKTSFFLKDVAEKLHGVALDAGIPDCTSTALALVIEKINNCYNDWYHCYNKLTKIYKLVETIAKDVGKVDIAAIMNHSSFGDYCDDVYDDLVDLICDLSCCTSPGTTGGGGGGGPTPTSYTLTVQADPEEAVTSLIGAGTYPAGEQVDAGFAADNCYTFSHWAVDIGNSSWIDGDLLNDKTLGVTMNGNVTLTAHFCPTIVGVKINLEQAVSELTRTIAPPDLPPLCLDQCAIITSVSIKFECDNFNVDLDLDDEKLEWVYDSDNVSFNQKTGAFCFKEGGKPDRYILGVTYKDPCGGDEWNDSLTVEFEDCEPCEPPVVSIKDVCVQLDCSKTKSVTLSADVSGGMGDYVYDWKITQDSSPVGTSDKEKPEFELSAGEYQVKLTVTDSCGEKSATATITVYKPCIVPEKLKVSSITNLSKTSGASHYLKVKFSNYSGDIGSGDYYGWCAHSQKSGFPVKNQELFAYCTLDADLGLQDYWPKINWIINNRNGYTRDQVQDAIWHYTNGKEVTRKAKELVNDADCYAANYCPEVGKKFVVLLTPKVISNYGKMYAKGYTPPSDNQPILIEVVRVNHCPPEANGNNCQNCCN